MRNFLWWLLFSIGPDGAAMFARILLVIANALYCRNDISFATFLASASFFPKVSSSREFQVLDVEWDACETRLKCSCLSTGSSAIVLLRGLWAHTAVKVNAKVRVFQPNIDLRKNVLSKIHQSGYFSTFYVQSLFLREQELIKLLEWERIERVQ